MGYFTEYYGKNEEDLSEGKRDLVERKVIRGFDSAVDSLKDDIIDLEGELTNYRIEIANGVTETIKTLALKETELEETLLLMKKITEERSKALT